MWNTKPTSWTFKKSRAFRYNDSILIIHIANLRNTKKWLITSKYDAHIRYVSIVNSYRCTPLFTTLNKSITKCTHIKNTRIRKQKAPITNINTKTSSLQNNKKQSNPSFIHFAFNQLLCMHSIKLHQHKAQIA